MEYRRTFEKSFFLKKKGIKGMEVVVHVKKKEA